MAMTTLASLAEIKTRLSIATGVTTDDAVLTQILEGVSMAIARLCNRARGATSALISAEWEEYFGGGDESLSLIAYPVTAVTSVIEAAAGDFANGDTLTEWTEYRLDDETGIITREGGLWLAGRQTVKVKYTGGYASNAVPIDLREACLRLATIAYVARQNPTRQSVAAQGGSMSVVDPGTWPKDVREMVMQFKRFV